MAKICLVSCVSKKLTIPTPAQDLYISPLFKKSRLWAEQNADKWYILSAKYGLVEPSTMIEPYNKTLKTMKIDERRAWATQVGQRLLAVTTAQDDIIFLAGMPYQEFLNTVLLKAGYSTSDPLTGMPIGKRLEWLNDNNR